MIGLFATFGLLLSIPAYPFGGGDTQLTEQQRIELPQYFGFETFQIYKLQPGIFQLRLADVNGDGRNDLALWNSRKNRIELFIQPAPGESAGESPAEGLERNEIANRGTMRNETVSVSNKLASMELADLTGDQRIDILFFGEPKELVILPGKKEGGFAAPISLRAPDGDARPGSLAVGDYNGDGRKDAALLGEEVILVYYQKEGGGLAAPMRLNHGVKQTHLVLTADLNGDGKDDLLVGVDDEEYGALVLLQEAGGLGPMRRVRVPNLRSITIGGNKGGDDVFTIEGATGRLKQYRWERPPEIATAEWPLILQSYPVKSKAKSRPVAFGDCTNDGFIDVVAADPEAAQLVLFRGGPNGLESGVAYPGLTKTLDLSIGDVDADGKNEVISVSREEKMVAVSQFSEGRLTFPTAVPFGGAPMAATVGRMKPDDKDAVVAVLAVDKSKVIVDGKEKEETRTQITLYDAKDRKQRAFWTLKSLDDDARGLRFADVNQDGLNDLLLFVRFSPLQTFLQKSDGTFEAFGGSETREALVKEAALEDFDFSDVTGDGKPEVLLAQKTLARALVIKDNRWEVVDQYNPESADAEFKGLAALPGEAGSPTIVAYDRKERNLVIFQRRADKAYGVARTMPVGTFDTNALAGISRGKDAASALFLADPQKLAMLLPGMAVTTLVEKQAFETKIKDGRLFDSVVGDLNGDGVRDVALLEGAKANVEIVTTGPGGELLKALHFQVFQGKRFSDAPDSRGDPREAVIGDVTGDGRDDLVLIAHDRLIVYPSQ